MQVITVVEGNVPNLRIKEFEANFALAKKEPRPPGLVLSALLRGSKSPDKYRIQTIWESREALEKMRSSAGTPKAIELFQKVGVRPTVEIFEIIDLIS